MLVTSVVSTTVATAAWVGSTIANRGTMASAAPKPLMPLRKPPAKPISTPAPM
jgi:hypothetical protein